MLQEQNTSRLVYLTEDDEDDRILFLEALRELHPEIFVKVFEDGQQLLDNLCRTEFNKPEIIFLDINMPRKNGFECLKEIRNRSMFRDVKIIMFSTSSSILHIELCHKLGADYYAIKPGPFHKLKELLSEIMAIDWDGIPTNKTDFVLTGRKINTI